MAEERHVLLDGYPVLVRPDGEHLVADDGRRVLTADAVHLAPTNPSKIICVHLNYASRVEEFKGRLPPAPTYFQNPSVHEFSWG